MPALWGRRISRDEFTAHLGSLEQVAEARVATIESGPERGSRVIQVRTPGLSYEILVDRGFDIGRCDAAGTGVGYRNSVGFPAAGPAPFAYPDALRLWGGGLLMTGGLDHIFGPRISAADHFRYPSRSTQLHPAHGRIWMTPATIIGLGTEWRDDDLVVFAEAEVRQVSAFGENLVLRRRIETIVGMPSIHVHDSVRNDGHAATPHMLLYHVNVGAPLAWPGSRVILPRGPVEALTSAPSSQATVLPPASSEETERVFHVMSPSGMAEAAVHDPKTGWVMTIRYDSTTLPHLLVWQSISRGGYGLGLEPTTHSPVHDDEDRRNDLLPSQSRTYDLEVAFSRGEHLTEEFG